MLRRYKTGIFEAFDNTLYIPSGYTGKMTHRYIDERKTGYITDYKGNTIYYDELSAIHLENADYTLSLSREYVDFLISLKGV